MDDGGPGQTKGVVKEETREEEDMESKSATKTVWPRRRPRGKVDGEARIAAREEVWPYRGPRGMDDSRKI